MTPRPAQRPPTAHPVTAAARGLAAALVLSGCQISSPLTTTLPYDAADGVSVDAGALQVRDLAVVSEGSGAPGALIGLVVNSGKEPLKVTIVAGTTPLEPIDVAAGAAIRLDGQAIADGPPSTPQAVATVEPLAGSTIPVKITTTGGGIGSALVPVLPPTDPYDGLVEQKG